MKVYYADELTYNEPRLHPYKPRAPGQHGYEDFKTNPAAIRTVLEDFRPLESWQAVQRFYEFLEWVNGSDSRLETSDCALRPPAIHNDPNSTHKLRIRGRVFILFRNLRDNASDHNVVWLCQSLQSQVEPIEPELPASEAVLGFTLNPVIHVALSEGLVRSDGTFATSSKSDPGLGKHLMVTFYAYGDDDAHAFANLDRMVRALWSACRTLSAHIEQVYRAALAAQASAPPSRAPARPRRKCLTFPRQKREIREIGLRLRLSARRFPLSEVVARAIGSRGHFLRDWVCPAG